MTFGVTAFGAYLPRLRLERSAIAEAHRWMTAGGARASGRRAFCGWDEDPITMAVEAGRGCAGDAVRSLVVASTTFPYADLANASVVAGALGLSPATALADASGSARAGLGALADALEAERDGALVIASERPRAKPASAQELSYGAGAAAFRLGREGAVARLVARASRFAPFIDHFRPTGGAYDLYWEERWIRDEGYAALAPEAAKAALDAAGLAVGDVAHLVVPSPLRGAAELVARRLGFAGAVADGLEADGGYAGAAQALLLLAAVLERARPGERVLVVGFAQGAEALVLEATEAVATYRPSRPVSAALADGLATRDYLRMLSFYDEIALDWGLRADRGARPALTEQYRSADQLSAFMAGRCRRCGAVQFPRLAFCVNPACRAPADELEPYSLVDEPATALTVTADWLTPTPSPPLHVGFVQFAGGARLLMEIVDVGPEGVDVGTPLRAVFRIKERDRARGYNRYFWKATPARSAAAAGGGGG